jgi:hypothetical protein
MNKVMPGRRGQILENDLKLIAITTASKT